MQSGVGIENGTVENLQQLKKNTILRHVKTKSGNVYFETIKVAPIAF